MKFPVDKRKKCWYHTKCADEETTNGADLERYRSGHNEAVLKTVCPQGRVGSNPTLSVHHDRIHDVNPWRSTQVAEGARLESE